MGVIGEDNVTASLKTTEQLRKQLKSEDDKKLQVDIVTLLREIQEVKVPDDHDRRNIERSIFHCLGLDTGMGGAHHFEFNNDGELITEADDLNDDGSLI